MPNDALWVGALSQLLIFEETGCAHSARHAIRLIDRLSESRQLDDDLRALCERAVVRLEGRMSQVGENKTGAHRACAA